MGMKGTRPVLLTTVSGLSVHGSNQHPSCSHGRSLTCNPHFSGPPHQAEKGITPWTRMVLPLAQVPFPRLLLPESSLPGWQGQGGAHGCADSPFILLNFRCPLSRCKSTMRLLHCCSNIPGSWLLLLCLSHVISRANCIFLKKKGGAQQYMQISVLFQNLKSLSSKG